MIINIIIACLAYFLAGQFPVFVSPFTCFLFWAAVLFFIAGVGYAYTYRSEGKNRWLF